MENYAKSVVEILNQFVRSPGWRCPIQDFIDKFCEVFEEAEENKLIYTEIWNEFCDMVEMMIENVGAAVGISEGVLVGVLDYALREKQYLKDFKHVLATVEFTVFKRIMVKRNIEIELETLKRLNSHKRSSQKDEDDLTLALTLSLIDQEEYESRRIQRINEENEELKRALEASSQSFIEDINREKQRLQIEINEFYQLLNTKEQTKNSAVDLEESLDDISKNYEQLKEKIFEENKRKENELENIRILEEKRRQIKEEREKLSQFKKNEEKKLIDKKIERKKIEDKVGKKEDGLKEEEKIEEIELAGQLQGDLGEGLEERRERLKNQRELVIQKLKNDRFEKFKQYLDNGGVDYSYKSEEISVLEHRKRKRILDKLKESKNLPFNQ